MSIQKIEISKLMDNYTDEEFFIEGNSAASAKAVTKRVMEQAVSKKSMKLRSKVLLIAASVAAAGILTAAALPYGLFQGVTGRQYEFYEYKTNIKDYDDSFEENPPYTEEDGRIYFTADGQHIDITDYFERGENYYYVYTDTDSQGEKLDIVLAVGGDIDDPSYGEMIYNRDNRFGLGAGTFANSSEVYCYYKDEQVIIVDTPEKRAESTNYPYRAIDKPCYVEFKYYERLWQKDVKEGREIDVNNVDRSLTFNREYTDWWYPEGWDGVRLSNDVPELPELN